MIRFESSTNRSLKSTTRFCLVKIRALPRSAGNFDHDMGHGAEQQNRTVTSRHSVNKADKVTQHYGVRKMRSC